MITVATIAEALNYAYDYKQPDALFECKHCRWQGTLPKLASHLLTCDGEQ